MFSRHELKVLGLKHIYFAASVAASLSLVSHASSSDEGNRPGLAESSLYLGEPITQYCEPYSQTSPDVTIYKLAGVLVENNKSTLSGHETFTEDKLSSTITQRAEGVISLQDIKHRVVQHDGTKYSCAYIFNSDKE